MTASRRGGPAARRAATAGPPQDKLSLSIAYAAVGCARCGDKRVAARPCPSCGKRPEQGEFDVKAQRRRKVADVLRERLREAAQEAQRPEDLGGLLGRLVGMPGRLTDALHDSDAGGDADSRATAAALAVVDELRTVRAQVGQPWPRPWRRYARDAAVVVEELHDALTFLVEAYSADHVGDAQVRMARAQACLDAAGQRARALGADLGFAEQVVDLDVGDLLSACLTRELDRLGAAGGGMDALRLLDLTGRARLPGLAGTGTPGIGLQVQAVLLPSAVLLDPDSLLGLCRTAHALLDFGGPLRDLALDPGWQARQRDATTVLLDACERLARVADLPQRPVRHEVRDALLFVQDVVEGPMRHHFATLLACRGYVPSPAAAYAEARGTAVAAAREHLAVELTRGIPVLLRNASAHLDFEVEVDGVLLQASKGSKARRMSFEGLTDAVLALLETALALQLAVIAASDAEDLLRDDSDLLDELDPDLLLKLMLAALGWCDIAIRRDGSVLRVDGVSSLPAPVATIGMLLSRLDEHITDVELVARGSDRTRRLTARTEPFRRWSARPDPAEEFESMLLFADALAHVALDDAPAVTKPVLRHLAAVLAGQRINDDLPSAAHRLTRLRAWAAQHDDLELHDALTRTQRAVTSIAIGLAPTPAEQAAIATISAWEGMAAAMPGDW